MLVLESLRVLPSIDYSRGMTRSRRRILFAYCTTGVLSAPSVNSIAREGSRRCSMSIPNRYMYICIYASICARVPAHDVFGM